MADARPDQRILEILRNQPNATDEEISAVVPINREQITWAREWLRSNRYVDDDADRELVADRHADERRSRLRVMRDAVDADLAPCQ